MEKKKASSIDIMGPLKKFFKRSHLMLFFVFITACVAGAVILINNTLEENATDSTYTSSINSSSIDEATLNRLKALHTSKKGSSAPSLPSGRVNPFGE